MRGVLPAPSPRLPRGQPTTQLSLFTALTSLQAHCPVTTCFFHAFDVFVQPIETTFAILFMSCLLQLAIKRRRTARMEANFLSRKHNKTVALRYIHQLKQA